MLFKHSKDQGEEDNNYQLMTHNQKFDLIFEADCTGKVQFHGENISIQPQKSCVDMFIHSFTLLAIKLRNGSILLML